MPDGRFISKSISLSGQLKNVSLEADYLFGRMIPHLDRDGRTDGDPDVVKATACPLRAEMTPALIRTALGELDSVGLIEWYEVDGQMVCHFPAFAVHQRGMKYDREAPSRLPSREAQGAKPVRRSAAGARIRSGLTPDQVRTNSDIKAAEVPPSEVKLSEVKITASDDAGGVDDTSPDTPDRPPSDWAYVFAQDYNVASEGVISPGEVGKQVKPLYAKHPYPVVHSRWLWFVASPKREFGVAWFRKNFGSLGDPAPKIYSGDLSPDDFKRLSA